MLYTKQDKLIVSIRAFDIRHYATYFWQIDDEASLRGGVAQVSSIEQRTGQDTPRDRVSQPVEMGTNPRMASALSTGPVLAADKRAASTGIVRWNALRSRVSFIQRAGGGEISMVTFLCILRALE
jgi:hypothetical protein